MEDLPVQVLVDAAYDILVTFSFVAVSFVVTIVAVVHNHVIDDISRQGRHPQEHEASSSLLPIVFLVVFHVLEITVVQEGKVRRRGRTVPEEGIFVVVVVVVINMVGFIVSFGVGR
jgi:hypothetical protein